MASLTGINPVTLRAWERRYGLIKPKRTPKGHRLYSVEDIGQIRRILQLIEQGVAIGQVKKIIVGDASEPEAAVHPGLGSGPQGNAAWGQSIERMLSAAARFDPGSVRAVQGRQAEGVDHAHRGCIG